MYFYIIQLWLIILQENGCYELEKCHITKLELMIYLSILSYCARSHTAKSMCFQIYNWIVITDYHINVIKLLSKLICQQLIFGKQ